MTKVFRKMTGILLAVCMLASLFTCLLGLSVSAAGTTPDLVEYKGVNYTCMKYTKGWATIQAGNYRFQMDCKITSGTPLVQVGNDETGTTISGYQTNRVGTYDSVNYKYTFTFTMTSNWGGNLGVQVGNNADYGGSGDAVFACANPTLYLLDGDGNPTGSNLINTFASDYYSTSRAGNKWNRRNFTSSTATCTSPVPSGYFDPYVEPIHHYVHFEPNRNDYSRFLYSVGYKTLPAGDYRFQMDCKIFSGTPKIAVGNRDGGNTAPLFGDGLQTNYNASYDAENNKYTITFTLPSGLTGSYCIGVFVGNYGNTGDFVCAEPTLYHLDGSGDPTGDNLVNPFSSDYYSSSIKSGYWYRAGNYTCTELPDNYFETESDNNYYGHFIAGVDGYQVLAYKDNGIYAAANSVYRLKIDINNFSATEPTVQMRTGSTIGTAYTGTLISENGFERVYEFTVSSAATGIGLFIGNYGKGTDLDFAFRNPRLYNHVNGTYGTTNMLTPYGSANFDRHDWTGSRDNALNGKWTPINCNGSRFAYGTDDGALFPDPVSAGTGTPKMANVYHGFSYKPFIYNDSAIALKKGSTYVFTINQRVASGNPNIYLYDSYGGSNNSINNSTYTSSYTDVTTGYIRTITFTMAKSISSLRIRVGNYSDATDVAASFANPRLVEQGTTDNMIVGFTSNSFTTAGITDRMWYIASQQSGNNVKTHDVSDIPVDYFSDSPQKNMYYISDVTTAYSGLEYNANLAASTTYTLEFDWRNYGGAYPKVSVTYYNGSAWSSLAQTATSANKVDGTTTSLSGNLLPASVMNTSHYGHYAVTFTTPADISNSGYRNVNILFANVITNDDYTHYGRGSTYYGNFKLQKSGVSGNTILNGDLSIVDKTGLVSNNDGAIFHGFVVGIGKNNGSRDLYNDVAIVPQPDNFFTETGATYKKLVKFNGGDYDYFRQEMRLQSNTQYILYYNYTYVNAENGAYIQQVDTDNNYSTPTTQNTTDDTNQIKYVIFTTGTLRDTYFNFLLNFYIGRNAPDASFYFTNVQLRKWNGTSIVGPNLVDNGGFYFGDDAKAENGTQINIATNETSVLTKTNTLQLLGWKTFGKFQKNQNIEVIDAPNNFFTAYTAFNTRIPKLRKMLIGFEERGYHPYEDINSDDSFDVKDYVHTKLAWLESVGTATTTAAEQFKATYVNGNNTTDLTGMDINLFGNKTRPTGTVYYVDSDNGNDSNSGTSPSAAWQSLNKVNTASISSGSAVLFKCGGVWRPKLNDCSSTNWSGQAALRCKAGVTYGSYGSGNKPVILGSYYNYKNRSWTSAGTNIWKTSINLSGYYHCNDVGIIVYNYGALIGNMTLSKAALSKEGDFFCRTPDGTDGGDGYVYVYCTENPANHWKSIEIGQKRHICRLADNVTINNICFKYGGWHGLTNTNLSAVCISNCEISYIGGCYSNSRLGNGVEFGQTAANCRVKNCYVRECYDAGLTFQCWSGTGSFQSINFSNNLIENCNYSIEFFVENASDKMKDIYLTNNICRGAGYGWSYDEREGYGPEGEIGCFRTSHIRCTQDVIYTNLDEFYIQNNIFDTAKGALIYWWWNDSDHTDANPVYSGLHISGNTFYQTARSSDDRIIQFKNEKGVYGSSTYGVREALKLFESTDTPTHLNDSKFLVSERVISTY